MEKLYKDGDILIEELAHTALEGSTKSSTLYFIKILSSLGASPCDYLKTKHSECRLIAKGVPQDGKVWDLYLMNCHYGPPCEFFETL
jgi:hypothetical protein